MASFRSRDPRPGGLVDINPVKAPPLVGRGQIIDAAVDALRGGSTGAVMLVAEAGLGKSVLAEAIATSLSGEMIVMRVHGSPSLSNVPYGVLAPYLVDLPDDPTNSQIAILRAFWAQFERLRAGRDLPLLLVVDDAHELDEATSNVIVDLIIANWAKVVAASRPRPGPPASMMQFWYDTMAERFELEPLTRDHVEQIVEHVLGAPVLATTVQLLWEASEGNPMMLQCLVQDSREAGVLTRKNGVWLLTAPVTADGPAVTGMVRNQLLRRTAAEREALSMIALAEPVRLDAIEASIGPDMVQSLVESQLVALDSAGETDLRLRHPIYGEAVRSMVSASRSLQLRQQLIGYLDRQPPSEAAVLRMVRWSLDAGVSVSEGQLLRAAQYAARNFQNAVALNLAARLHDEALRPQARAVAARAHFNSGHYNEALSALETGTHSGPQDEPAPGWILLQLSIRACLGEGQNPVLPDPAELKKVLHEDGDPAEAVRGLFALDLAGELDRLADALDGLEPVQWVMNRPNSDALAMFLLAMKADVLLFQGDPKAAAAALDKATDYLENDSGDLFFFREFLMYRKAAALLDAGEWHDAERVLAGYEEAAGAGLFTFGGSLQYLRGLSLVRQGLLDKAFRVLKPAVESLRINDPQQVLGPALALAAYTAARSGDAQHAEKLLDQAGELGIQRVAPMAGMFAAAARASLAKGGTGLAEIQEILSTAERVLPPAVELQGLSLLFELEKKELGPRIFELTDGMTGRWARAWSLYAGAQGHQDAAACLEAGETIRGLGTIRLARDCFARAVLLYEASGDRLGVRQSTTRRDYCERELGEQLGADSESTSSAVVLTRRERDIITLAVQGLTDRQIAEKLMVSVRTVEGHLYRSYVKLGIRSREELSEAAGL